ncbi:MAG: DNRLRE domain-containing protein, partial [Prevotellaceae bacterium]|nr:DNRLRE domain-containing protein [Prevotellaceae bacterium]
MKKIALLSLLMCFNLVAGAALHLPYTASESKTMTFDAGETTRLHAGTPDQVLYDASATNWTCTQTQVAGNAFNDSQKEYGGSYFIITKFDLSSLPKDVTITEVTLNFTSVCTVSGKNSMLQTSRIGTGWDAATATWNNANTPAIMNAQPTIGGPYVNTSTANVSIDVTGSCVADLVSGNLADGKLGFAIYTYTAREQKVSDIKLSVKYLEAGYNQSYATLTHTASVQGGSNEPGIFIDQETHYYNNWGNQSWAAQVYAEFDFSNIADGQKVVDAEMTVTVNCAKGTRTFDINYLPAGTEIDYNNLELTSSIGTPVATYSDITTSYVAKKVDVTDVINAFLAAGEKKIIFIMSNGAAGGNIYGKASSSAPTLGIVTTSSETTSYTVTFHDASGIELKKSVTHDGALVGHKVSAPSSDLAPIEHNGHRYLYASGNNAITLSNVASDNVIPLVFEMGADRLPAFPEAKGWGRYAEGGRTGKVYHVTNLNDSGTGSLRDAVSSPNRIVVFDVAGVIRISSRIVFSHNLYVAGQTAPGEGITVYGDGVSFSGANNTIVRYMRFRMGAVGTKDKDCAGVANGTNMIFDHCSFSWGLDETFSINSDGNGDLRNFTLSNCIFGQGLMSHSAGGLMQGDSITLYRNFYCDNNTRNNKVKGINQYVNNVVYNWNNGAYIMGGDSEGQSFCNIVGNLFINGPAGGGNAFSTGNTNFHCYLEDNIQDSNRDGKFNPSAVTNNAGADVVSTPYPYPALEAWKANTLIDNLIPNVGASLPYRDLADCYMVEEVMSMGTKGALIANEKNLPIGAPDSWKMWAGNKRVDTDGDGMPDEWEKANGTDPSTDDAMAISTTGYTNIENYINSITADDRDFFLRAPMLLTQTDATTTSISVSWSDYTANEDGFVIEANGKEVARTGKNVTAFIIEGLIPDASYSIRIRAFKGSEFSEYTDAVVMKTKPETTEEIDVENFAADAIWTPDVAVWAAGSTGWKNGKTYEDGQNVLFETTADHSYSVGLINPVAPAAVVVRGDGDFTFDGED